MHKIHDRGAPSRLYTGVTPSKSTQIARNIALKVHRRSSALASRHQDANVVLEPFKDHCRNPQIICNDALDHTLPFDFRL